MIWHCIHRHASVNHSLRHGSGAVRRCCFFSPAAARGSRMIDVERKSFRVPQFATRLPFVEMGRMVRHRIPRRRRAVPRVGDCEPTPAHTERATPVLAGPVGSGFECNWRRIVKASEESDRAGTRTQDQRINVPHRLSPTADFHEAGVESLDYLFALAGVPRIVSEAATGDPPPACLLMAQSPAFSDHHACRCRRRCGGGGSQGVPANSGMHPSRFGFFPRGAPWQC